MADGKQTDLCITASEFEELALAVGRGEGGEEMLKKHQSHVLSGCQYCVDNWDSKPVLSKLPDGVWRVHLDTLRQRMEELRQGRRSDGGQTTN